LTHSPRRAYITGITAAWSLRGRWMRGLL